MAEDKPRDWAKTLRQMVLRLVLYAALYVAFVVFVLVTRDRRRPA
jgi:hypothetical protein